MSRLRSILDLKRYYGVKSFELIPESANLPFETTQRNIANMVWQGFLALLLAVGIACIFLPFNGFRESGFGRSFMISAIAAALGQIVLSIHQMRIARWRFTATEVSCRSWRLLRRSQWQEPLSAYQGILRKTHFVSGVRRQIAVYQLTLQHSSDKHKSVLLHRSKHHKESIQRQKHYARLFNLPALIETVEGILTSEVEDLDKSVVERVAEGTLAAEFHDYAPPKDLSVKVEKGAVTLVVQRRYPGIELALVGTALILLGGAIIYILRDEPLDLIKAVGFVIACTGGALLVISLLFTEELSISRDSLQTCMRSPWRRFRHQKIASSKISHVLVARGGVLGSPDFVSPAAIHIVTGEETIVFGRKLRKASKKWVRNCIIAVISKGVSKGESAAETSPNLPR